jgi:hypothetical protein
MPLLAMPVEMLQQIAFQGGACSLFGFILLVRAASTCSALHAAIAAVRHLVVAHFNARLLLPPAYLYGEYGPLGRTWSVGVKDSNGIDCPINCGQKLTFEVHAVDDVEMPMSLRILVVLKVRIVFAPVMGSGATLVLNLALNFFDVGFSLCAALGWPNGTLQAEHVRSEAKKGRILQALRKDAFDRHVDNQPQTLSIDWRHPLSKLSVRVPDLHTHYKEAPNLVEYAASLKRNIRTTVEVMRAVHNLKCGYTGREFDPKPHLWLQLTGLNHIKMYSSFTVRELYPDGSPIITNFMTRMDGFLRIEAILKQHLYLNQATLHPADSVFVFEQLTFETDGELNDKASGIHLMHTFGYLEHRAAHRAEVRRRLEAAAVATVTARERRPKRAAAAAAEKETTQQIKVFRSGERQDEPEDGSHLLPAW